MLKAKISKTSKTSLTGSPTDLTRTALNINRRVRLTLSYSTLTKLMLWVSPMGCHLPFTRRQRLATLISQSAL
jgi:hypothetical protein